eukprot:15002634-Heterocapsa_arctica.AAC.1
MGGAGGVLIHVRNYFARLMHRNSTVMHSGLLLASTKRSSCTAYCFKRPKINTHVQRTVSCTSNK